jgi:ribosomal large subunit pseudouridine synthase B (EC 5.4.99.-)
MHIRLQKALSQAAIASRRKAEALILAGRVKVNGVVVRELGTKIDPNGDRMEVDGQPVRWQAETATRCLLMHKPVGVICSRRDPQGRTTIYDLLPANYHNFYYVGRLDFNTSGALLLTNNGTFANNLSHPKWHIDKTYQVLVKGNPPAEVIARWARGVTLEGKMTLPAQVRVLGTDAETTLLEVTLQEGRNRQIRKTGEILGFPVVKLHRVAIASIRLNHLAVGKYRLLTTEEMSDFADYL